MSYINSTLTIEKNFFAQSEIEGIVKENITNYKRFQTNINDARKRQFFYSLKTAVSVWNVVEWYDNGGKQELADKEIVWIGNDFGQKLFKCNKQNISKLKTAHDIVIEDENAPDNYFTAVKEFEAESGKSASLSIESFKKWWANDQVLAEAIIPETPETPDTDEDGESDDESGDDGESSGSESKISITIKLDEYTTICLREEDGQYISHNTPSAIANALNDLASKVARQGVITSADNVLNQVNELTEAIS